MKIRTFIKLAAFEAFLFGLVFLVTGGVTGGFNVQPTALSEYATRSVGALLLSMAVVNWLLRKADNRILLRIVWADLAMHVLTGALDVNARVSGMAGDAAWAGVVVHASFIIGCIYYLLPRSKQ